MEYAILILSLISGSIFRRWWGGWYQPDSTIKRLVGFLLPFTVCFILFSPSWHNLFLSVVVASFVSFGWMMPKHGYGISMGRWPDHPLWACIIVMLLQYGSLTVLAGIVWEYITPHSGGLYYAPMGCMVSLAYYVFNELWDHLKLKPWGEYPQGNVFIDGAGSYAELTLGAILIGGIPLAHILAV